MQNVKTAVKNNPALITVAGPPSTGKTSVIIHALQSSLLQNLKFGVIKFDCLNSFDEERYARYNIPARTGIAGNLCPDHYFVSNLEECHQWGIDQEMDLVVLESAGLCNRCAPHLRHLLSVCVLDCLSGIETPLKTGPMLKNAQVVIVTKSDLVSQAEREVFRFKISQVNSRAKVIMINGISGQGSDVLASMLRDAPSISDPAEYKLSFSMPSAMCSYCLGETRVGKDYQIGLQRKLKL